MCWPGANQPGEPPEEGEENKVGEAGVSAHVHIQSNTQPVCALRIFATAGQRRGRSLCASSGLCFWLSGRLELLELLSV